MNNAIKLQTKPQRRYDIDALRVLAVLLRELIKRASGLTRSPRPNHMRSRE